MLVHLCVECGRISINRIAADDDPDTILRVFTDSFELDQGFIDRIEASGIKILQQPDHWLVRMRLYGRNSSFLSLGIESLIP